MRLWQNQKPIITLCIPDTIASDICVGSVGLVDCSKKLRCQDAIIFMKNATSG